MVSTITASCISFCTKSVFKTEAFASFQTIPIEFFGLLTFCALRYYCKNIRMYLTNQSDLMGYQLTLTISHDSTLHIFYFKTIPHYTQIHFYIHVTSREILTFYDNYHLHPREVERCFMEDWQQMISFRFESPHVAVVGFRLSSYSHHAGTHSRIVFD